MEGVVGVKRWIRGKRRKHGEGRMFNRAFTYSFQGWLSYCMIRLGWNDVKTKAGSCAPAPSSQAKKYSVKSKEFLNLVFHKIILII